MPLPCPLSIAVLEYIFEWNLPDRTSVRALHFPAFYHSYSVLFFLVLVLISILDPESNFLFYLLPFQPLLPAFLQHSSGKAHLSLQSRLYTP